MKNYQYLNLEQKMLRIRRKMPTLLKRFYVTIQNPLCKDKLRAS